MAIRVLVVTDGDRFTYNPPSGGNFSIRTLVNAFLNSTVPSISVATAHRRGADRNETNATIFGNFVFTQTNLSNYDVIWLIGDEGFNQHFERGSALTDDEKIVLADFMEGGGGVFAVGDHDGIGASMCGDLLRVRTMRKWFEYDHVPAGFPANWSTGGYVGGTPQGIARADTLQPDSADGQFYFDGQSDPRPQPVTFPPGPVHQILQGPNGPIAFFPDHMHEGEAIELPDGSPFLTGTVSYNGATHGARTYTEYATVAANGYRERPKVLARGTEIAGHTTLLGGAAFVPTDGKTIGLLSAYDGHNVNVGRVLIGSTFHHYLDINLIGNPGTSSTTPGAGPTGSDLGLPPDVLAGIVAYYQNAVVWLARSNANCYLWVEKSTFGVDEVTDAASYADAFFIVLDGFTPAQAGASPAVAFAGPFAAIPGMHVAHGAPQPEFPGSPNAAQRILIPCTITFTLPQSIPAFPVSPAPSKELLLEASVQFPGQNLNADAVFELVSGADPYFTNVNSALHNQFWLSQDLRVFTVTPGSNATPFPGATFPGGNPTVLNAAGGYQYIQSVLNTLNASYHDPNGPDPFASVLPQQGGAFTGDSSVTPHSTNPGDSNHPFINYNFAVARVRLQGAAGTSADHVKVFFRLYASQSNDTDYQPNTTYLSTPDASGLPGSPLLGPDHVTIPFFATGNYPGSNDYAPGGVNNRHVTVPGGAHGTWAYFGCFLNVYDPSYLSGSSVQAVLPGTHHCIVAQIAYNGAPIVNANGITLSPGNSDKLAQRNMQITASDNPGAAATHRIPQTFDLRPSADPATEIGSLLDRTDELMIDWGNTPPGSIASIYWPAVDARDVLRIASYQYSSHALSAADPHTIQCEVGRGPTFVPIPAGTGTNFAGLFTIDLPPTVVHGQEFHIVVRRGSTRRFVVVGANANVVALTAAAARKSPTTRNWRYGVGTFQITIQVSNKHALLLPEENTLAILKWRLSVMPPSNRWYPVLQRYIDYVGARVDGFGGNATAVLPSPDGYIPGGGGHAHDHRLESTGKVAGVCYDRFGDFEGFLLLTEAGHERAFRSREGEIEELVLAAWRERFVISVFVHANERDRPVSIVLRRAPREDDD
ncbi:MAG: hypothetical protein JWM87_1507 [Candidatus Eremiobacteraeota bacterium]|nr:hypothetical protein [Candidatus Eremiobacteraeota bacterium]